MANAWRSAWGVALSVWTLGVGVLDNILRPILLSGRTSMHGLLVFISLLGGVAAFGFIGLFLGPIVLGLLVALFRFTSEELAPESNEA